MGGADSTIKSDKSLCSLCEEFTLCPLSYTSSDQTAPLIAYIEEEKSNLNIWIELLQNLNAEVTCSLQDILVYQPVLSQGLIRINIQMRSIIIIIYLILFSSFKYSKTYSKICIYHYLVTIDLSLHHTSIYIRYICSVELFVYELVFLSLPSYMNIWWHIS